eukprot:5021775-Prymnesium_polylepis.1
MWDAPAELVSGVQNNNGIGGDVGGDGGSGDGSGVGGVATGGGDGDTADNTPLVPSSLFSLSPQDAPEVLMEEVPNLSSTLIALRAELKMKDGDENKSSDFSKWKHIKNSRDAVHVMIRNLCAPPVSLRNYGPLELHVLVYYVINSSGLVARDVAALFDPSDGDQGGQMDQETLRRLYERMEFIDNNMLLNWFDFPRATMMSLFSGSIFTKPSTVIATCASKTGETKSDAA